ncbi:hypothetical protein SARC_09675 [Sphaeroforma arctica JP610]|uniref:Uncharacterized protein n=1 Tax=Sphaeroforma arctica JP610 TaxID=667725 RepID=A0A0L0FM91_9EUKA|nr:hypothetical protein SARC_09675 [Sphaeroforma arctica JP610]KNC77875.1 hypothetical protein SARC_09675 [Sphaeroforma arctica JP610]|eukprot:XP_014151777.1 hypothetical protein SARC_09675 [Sphaeroforma arctica JP610]
MMVKFDQLLGKRSSLMRYIPRGGVSYLLVSLCILVACASYLRHSNDDTQDIQITRSTLLDSGTDQQQLTDNNDDRYTTGEVLLDGKNAEYQVTSQSTQIQGNAGVIDSNMVEYNPKEDRTQAIQRGKQVMAESRMIIIGLVKNMGDLLAQGNITRRIEQVGEMFKDYKVLVIENDSTDDTVTHLRNWSKVNERVQIISSEFKFDKDFGKSTNHIRFKRMALIRNIYMLELAINPLYADADYVSLLDMDNREGWSLDGLATSFALPQSYLPKEKGAAFAEQPLEWDVVCANGQLNFPALAWEYSPPGKPSVKELVQKHKGLDAMIKATRGMREPPHRYAEFAGLVANGTYEYARHAYELVVKHTKHYVYTKVTKETNEDYGGCHDVDMGGELQGEGVPGLIAFIGAQLKAKQDKAVQVIVQNRVRSKEDQAKGGPDNESGVDPEIMESAKAAAIGFTFKTCDENDTMAVQDKDGVFDAGATMAKKLMQHIHAPRDILEGSTPERTNECFEAAIAHWYRQGVQAREKAALNFASKYHIVPGRHYDSLAFRDSVFQNSNFRAHQYVTHLVTDWPYYVDSCFGGLAVYRFASMKGCQYDTETRECEHSSMHQCMAEKGRGKVLFNPAMVVKYVMGTGTPKKT